MSRIQIAKIIFNVILPPVLVITLFVVAIGMVIIPATEEALLNKKRDTIQAIVMSATSIIERHAQMEQDGLVSREQAQKIALEEMRVLRYGVENTDYLWITDLSPTMVMHPFFPDLEGTRLDTYADPDGKLIFVEAVDIAKEDGDGYISYMWPKPNNTSEQIPKLSYVRLFEPWNWVVGSGIYLDDVQKEIQEVTKRLLIISAWIGGIVFLILLFIIRRGWKSEKQRFLFETELKRSRERYQALAHASGEMVFLIIDGVIAGVNKKACEVLGYKEEEIIARRFSEFISDANAESILNKTVQDENNNAIEVVINGKFGSERVLLSVERAMVHEQSAIMYAGRSFKLQEPPDVSFVSFETINKNGFGVLKLENSLHGKILSADHMASELLKGNINKTITGRAFDSIVYGADAHRLFLQVQATAQAKNMVLRYTLSDGSIGYLQANASIIVDNPLQEKIILLFITDVTEIQSIQRSSDALLSEYLSPERNISHKAINIVTSPNEESMKQTFIQDKIILKQSIKIGSAPAKISDASMRAIQGVFNFAVEKAISEIGAPPCKYALLAYGSIGRNEPTLTADQDTGIIFESTDNDTVSKEYFTKFGRIVTDICSSIGIPPCNAGNTASNPEWCKSELDWQRQFSDWINRSQPEDLILVNIFFDFCVLSGDEKLAKALRQHIFNEVEKKPSFLFNLAQDTLSFKSPLDLLGNIRSDSKQGDFVNLKGTMLHFVNFARIYALKHGINETNTIKRLQILTKLGHIPSDTGKDTIEAWELLSEIRLKNQVCSLELNFAMENTIILEELSALDEISLSRAMSQVNNIQKRITSDLEIRV